MICRVCHMPQPGPHTMSCRPAERKAALVRHINDTYGPAIRSARVRAELHEDSTPWGEAPIMGAMLAWLDAFCARYASTCTNPEKAAQVRMPSNGRVR